MRHVLVGGFQAVLVYMCVITGSADNRLTSTTGPLVYGLTDRERSIYAASKMSIRQTLALLAGLAALKALPAAGEEYRTLARLTDLFKRDPSRAAALVATAREGSRAINPGSDAQRSPNLPGGSDLGAAKVAAAYSSLLAAHVEAGFVSLGRITSPLVHFKKPKIPFINSALYHAKNFDTHMVVVDVDEVVVCGSGGTLDGGIVRHLHYINFWKDRRNSRVDPSKRNAKRNCSTPNEFARAWREGPPAWARPSVHDEARS